MNQIAWYKKQMENPDLPRETYMQYWNTVRDLEFNANRVYQEGLRRCETEVRNVPA